MPATSSFAAEAWTAEQAVRVGLGSLGMDALASSPEHSLAHLWDLRLSDLLSIRRLSDDWDGEGAEAPGPELVDLAITLLDRWRASGVAVPERIVPSPNGTVVIEWQWPHAYLEADVINPRTIEWMIAEEGREPAHPVTVLDQRFGEYPVFEPYTTGPSISSAVYRAA